VQCASCSRAGRVRSRGFLPASHVTARTGTCRRISLEPPLRGRPAGGKCGAVLPGVRRSLSAARSAAQCGPECCAAAGCTTVTPRRSPQAPPGRAGSPSPQRRPGAAGAARWRGGASGGASLSAMRVRARGAPRQPLKLINLILVTVAQVEKVSLLQTECSRIETPRALPSSRSHPAARVETYLLFRNYL
jgi:hypothetical protein